MALTDVKPIPQLHIKGTAPVDLPFGAKSHPSFGASDADILLCSRDDVLFRVHSRILHLTSGWFRALLSLPQCPPSYQPSTSPEVIHVAESSKVVAGLLGMSTGQELPKFDSFEFLDELLRAAEKYEMTGAISVIRLAIMTPSFLDKHPVRVYGIASQWGWTEEAKLASTKTISVDLLAHDAVKDLHAVEPPHLTPLLLLHRRRRDILREGLDSHSNFYANNLPGRCSNCQREVAHVNWMHLKHVWSTAAEHHPADVLSGAILHQPEVHSLLDASCPHCQRKLYNAEGTITKLKSLLDRLPTEIEVRHYQPLPQFHTHSRSSAVTALYHIDYYYRTLGICLIITVL